MKILLATEKPFAASAVKLIKEQVDNAGYELVLLEKYTDQAQLVDAVKMVDALIVRSDKATKEVIESGKNLKIIVRAGAGFDNVDLAAATEKGIVVMNTPGQNSNAVAELALGMMLMAARNNYSGKSGGELLGKTLGIHAYGNVGKLVAKIGQGFGMKVFAFDPFVAKADIEKDGVTVVDAVEDLYGKSQYLSLHIPANDKTKQSVNYALLNKMPKGAALINTARKEVIHEDEMVKLMHDREDFKYYSDIAPGNADYFKAHFDGRFFFTPKKIGAETSEANVNAGIAAARQIVNFFKSGDKTFQVNKQ